MYKEKWNWNDSLALRLRAHQIAKSAPGMDVDKLASIKMAIGLDYSSNGDHRNAKCFSHDALNLYQSKYGSGHLNCCLAMENKAIVHIAYGEAYEAEKLIEEAKKIRKKAGNINVMASENNRLIAAQIRGRKGEYTDAKRRYQKSFDILCGLRPRPTVLLSQVLREIGTMDLHCGNYLDALASLRKNLAMEIQSTQNLVPARTEFCFGQVYHQMGEYKEALKHYQTAILLCQRHDLMIIPDSYASIAAVYYDQGDYEASMREYRRSLEYLNSNFGEHHLFSWKTLAGIGKVYYSQGNYQEAVVQFKEAIRIVENENLTLRVDSAGPLSNLGLAYGQLGDYESSLRIHARALRIKDGHYESGEVKMNMAITFMHQGKLNKAIALLKDVLFFQEAGYGVDHIKTADTLMYLGLALQRQKQADAGEVYLTRCLRIHDKSFQPDHPRTLRVKALMDGNVRSGGREQPTISPGEESWCLLP